MSGMGLNDHHEEEVKKFLKFARYNRQQQLRSVEGSFQDLKDSRLQEDTFTSDEVQEMIDGLMVVVKGAVETELLNAAHTNVLLLFQLFSQAERWHLKLQADISELENQKLLKDIADFEEQEASGRRNKNLDLSNLAKSKLEPLNEGGSAALLQMEISRLKEENDTLKRKITTLEKSTNSSLSTQSRLRADLEEAQKNRSSSSPRKDGSEREMLSDKISSLSDTLREAELNYNKKFSSVNEELVEAKHYILNLQHELETLHGEFDKKFSETTQFKNLKKMLEGKNTQLKELRVRVKKYEPDCEL